uniref:Uncharacterized protein n=1 Tax=Timema genevievae TaxID=629358 RepID=A0A7R9PIE5_TIMGE|nr:unnamed protein product [Timema genevievae]
MQCEIRGMADVAEAATSSADTLPKPGRVNEGSMSRGQCLGQSRNVRVLVVSCGFCPPLPSSTQNSCLGATCCTVTAPTTRPFDINTRIQSE